jgi:peptidyl-prolyl cis-trans isomerase C
MLSRNETCLIKYCKSSRARQSLDKKEESQASKQKQFHRALATSLICVFSILGHLPYKVAAEEAFVAIVNGKKILEFEVKLAEIELKDQLTNIDPASRRPAIIDFLIENELLAAAGEKVNVASDPEFIIRRDYALRKLVRDTYVDLRIASTINDAELRKIYDEQVSSLQPREEIRTRHILVSSRAKADELRVGLLTGGDFVALAASESRDLATSKTGGDLGYVAKGQLLEPLERAAFNLKRNELSQPVQTELGWHLVKIEDRRMRPAPTFDEIRTELTGMLLISKIRAEVANLRKAATIELAK